MRRYEMGEAAWRRLGPLLPPERGSLGGRPPKDRRRVLNGILWILRSGARWRDLPERYGPWQTVANSFYRWRRAGVWSRVLAELQRQADERGELDWALHHVDSKGGPGTPACRGRKRGQQHEALGRSRGGFSTMNGQTAIHPASAGSRSRRTWRDPCPL